MSTYFIAVVHNYYLYANQAGKRIDARMTKWKFQNVIIERPGRRLPAWATPTPPTNGMWPALGGSGPDLDRDGGWLPV